MPALLVDPAAAIAFAAVIGLLVGSFLNVLIHRVPRMLQRDWREQSAALLVDANLGDAAASLRTWSAASGDSAPLREASNRILAS